MVPKKMYIKKIKKNKVYKYREDSINIIFTKKSKIYIIKKTNYYKLKKFLRIEINFHFKYSLTMDNKKNNDVKLNFKNFHIIISKSTINKIKNTEIYFKIKKKISGFNITNYNLLKNLQSINTNQLNNWIINKNKITLLDARNKKEWIKDNVKKSILFKNNYNSLKLINKYEKIIIICKYGYRSLTQSKKLIKLKFKRIYNLSGGMKKFNS